MRKPPILAWDGEMPAEGAGRFVPWKPRNSDSTPFDSSSAYEYCKRLQDSFVIDCDIIWTGDNDDDNDDISLEEMGRSRKQRRWGMLSF
jgi:hypothetical protein